MSTDPYDVFFAQMGRAPEATQPLTPENFPTDNNPNPNAFAPDDRSVRDEGAINERRSEMNTVTHATEDDQIEPFVSHAETYLAAGWNVFPVMGKGADGREIPKGVTGNAGVCDAEKVGKWLLTGEYRRLPNISIRHTDTISIDVDVRGDKHGDDTMEKFAAEHGLPELPPTYSSTARGDDSASRQYFFRVPADPSIPDRPVKLRDKPGAGVEICQRHHRHSVAYPSIHPDTGTPYRWYAPGTGGFTWGARFDGVPAVVDLPELPGEWLSALASRSRDDRDYDAEVTGAEELLATFADGAPSKPVAAAIERARTQHPGHDETGTGLFTAFMFGREGHPGVRELVNVLVNRHREYVADVRPGREYEVDALVTFNAEKAQQMPIDPESVYRPAFAGLTTLGGSAIAATAVSEPVESAVQEKSDHILPRSFWDSTPELQELFRYAMARRANPDAVLHVVLAIIAAHLPHGSTLDTGIAPGVLIHFAVVTGPSGHGKSKAINAARDYMELWMSRSNDPLSENQGPRIVTIGSPTTGEGLLDSFLAKKKDDNGVLTKVQVRHNAFLFNDEARSTLTNADKIGSTLFPTICDLWTGTDVSHLNVDPVRYVAAKSYSIGMVLGLQDDAAGPLFGDNHGGAPQRFAYVPVIYPGGYGTRRGIVPPPLDRKPPTATLAMRLSDEQMQVVIDEDDARDNGWEPHPLEAHRRWVQCRMAGLLSVFHGEYDVVSDLVWNLSEQMSGTSTRHMHWLSQYGKREQARLNAERRKSAVETAVATELAVAETKVEREVYESLMEKLDAGRELRSKLRREVKAGPRRDAFDVVAARAIESGKIRVVRDTGANGRAADFLEITPSE